ncbi:unnamed protein product [Sphagnum balticum]
MLDGMGKELDVKGVPGDILPALSNGTKIPNHKVKKKREMAPGASTVTSTEDEIQHCDFKKAIPGKKEATHHETDIQPSESPEIILHILEAM